MAITSLSQLDFNGSYTYSQYLKWRFEEYVELIRGKIFPMSAPVSQHQRIVGNLHIEIGFYLKGKHCQVFIAPFDVRFPAYDANGVPIADTDTVVQPDLCIICDPQKIDRRGCNGAPDLIVEVLSPSTAKKDLNEKFNLYEEAGVQEYWVVFPDAKVINVYLLQNGKYVLRDEYEEDAKIPVATLPELVVNLADVFAQT